LPTATIQSYVENALRIREQSDRTYLALGKTSPWENENIPPVAEENVEDLQELVGFKKMDTVSLCKELPEGATTSYPTVKYRGKTWKLVPDADAHSEEAYHVFFSTVITGDDLPLGEYRQVGVYTNIVSDATILLPDSTDLSGRTLFFYDNRERFNRTDRVTVTESFIINMRATE